MGETDEKIDPLLRSGLKRYPDNLHAVTVVFIKLPNKRTLDQLRLEAVPPKEAIGVLRRDEILALAKRPDVRVLRGQPQSSPR